MDVCTWRGTEGGKKGEKRSDASRGHEGGKKMMYSLQQKRRSKFPLHCSPFMKKKELRLPELGFHKLPRYGNRISAKRFKFAFF